MNLSAVSRANDAEILDLPWGTLSWRVSRALGNSNVMTFGRATIRAGMSNPRHRHPNCDEVLHVLSGSIEHWLGDESCIMKAGDTISIPTGVWHQARALGDSDAVMAICFSSADRETEMEEAA
jgi:quercetin dioxygenase-like cupin family protein